MLSERKKVTIDPKSLCLNAITVQRHLGIAVAQRL